MLDALIQPAWIYLGSLAFLSVLFWILYRILLAQSRESRPDSFRSSDRHPGSSTDSRQND